MMMMMMMMMIMMMMMMMMMIMNKQLPAMTIKNNDISLHCRHSQEKERGFCRGKNGRGALCVLVSRECLLTPARGYNDV